MSGTTVKTALLLATPPTVTTTFPVVAPVGTFAAIFDGDQDVGVAAVPLKVTVEVPCVGPNALPIIVTDEPGGPEFGLRLEILGRTVKGTPLLATPATVTTTLPVAAPLGTKALMFPVDHEDMAAITPLKVTVLVLCEVPKPVPAMVTNAPAAADDGVRLVMTGDAGLTTKLTALLDTPLPRMTTTGPEVAPVGTGATMLVGLQLVGVVAVPLNATVLVPCDEPKPVPEIVTK